MITKQLNEPIEIVLTGHSTVNYRLFISGASTPFYTGKAYSYPNTNTIILQLNDIIETQLSWDSFDITSVYDKQILSSWRKTFTLEYSYTTFGGSSVFETIVVANTYNKLGDDNQVGVDAEWAKIPALASNPQEIHIDTPLFLVYQADSAAVGTQRLIKVYCYNSQNQIQDAYDWFIEDTPANTIVSLKTSLSQWYTTGTKWIGFSHMDYTGGTPWTLCAKYLVNQDCTPDYNVYWINQFGGIEVLDGSNATKLNSNNTFADTKINYRTFNGSTMVGSESSLGVRRFISSEDTFKFVTKLLSDREHQYIESLYSSPKVWVRENNGDYFSVLSADSAYELKKFRTDKLQNRTINLVKTIPNKLR